MSKKASISDKIKLAVRASYAGCVCCGTWDARDCGHVISEKRGGTLDLSNLRLMCNYCNGALRSANCRFERYATPNDGARPIVETNRAAWIAYCNEEIRFWDAEDRVVKGQSKNNPYRRPAAYVAPM
jgi:hypothetical protein